MRNRRVPPRGPKSVADYSGGRATPLDDLPRTVQVRRQPFAVHPIVANELTIGEQHGDSCAVLAPELGIRVNVDDMNARRFVGAEDGRKVCTELLAERTAVTREKSPICNRHSGRGGGPTDSSESFWGKASGSEG